MRHGTGTRPGHQNGMCWPPMENFFEHCDACLWPQGPKAVHLKSCSSRDLRILPKKKKS